MHKANARNSLPACRSPRTYCTPRRVRCRASSRSLSVRHPTSAVPSQLPAHDVLAPSRYSPSLCPAVCADGGRSRRQQPHAQCRSRATLERVCPRTLLHCDGDCGGPGKPVSTRDSWRMQPVPRGCQICARAGGRCADAPLSLSLSLPDQGCATAVSPAPPRTDRQRHSGR